MILNKDASVVELSAAISCLSEAGCSIVRSDKDHLGVSIGQERVDLFIAEGYYTSCMLKDGSLMDIFNDGTEMIDYCSMLHRIVKALGIKEQIKPSPYIGQGRTTSWCIGEYHRLLESCSFIQWISE